jgi:hypothetical protein
MCVVWNGFVVLWYWNALRSGPPFMWLAMAICLPHAAVGLLLVYGTLAGLLNRTVIEVTAEFITVWQGPVPWWGNVRVPIDEIEQLDCGREPDPEEKETGPPKRRGSSLYRVTAVTRGAGTVELVTELDRAQALFIRQQLACWLNLGAGQEVVS